MKRLPLFGALFALITLASCAPTIDSGNQGVACFDTGSGMKCVPLEQLPANTPAMCIDKDGETDASQSSASGPSASDNDTSASSDAPGALLTDDPDEPDDDDAPDAPDGESDSSTEDDSGASDSTEETCGTGTDTDADGVSDSKDCDCLDVDTPTNVPPGGGVGTDGGGPVIL